MNDDTVFAAIGEEGFSQLVAAFYRQVADDAVLRPLYPEQDLQGAEQRLRDFQSPTPGPSPLVPRDPPGGG